MPPDGPMRQGFELKKFSCNVAKRQELFQSNRNCPTLTFRSEVITLRRKTGQWAWRGSPEWKRRWKTESRNEAHGERLTATIWLHPNRRCPTARDRRRAVRVSAAVLTTMASAMAVCLMDSAARWLRHHKLQGYADEWRAECGGRRGLPTEARADWG